MVAMPDLSPLLGVVAGRRPPSVDPARPDRRVSHVFNLAEGWSFAKRKVLYSALGCSCGSFTTRAELVVPPVIVSGPPVDPTFGAGIGPSPTK